MSENVKWPGPAGLIPVTSGKAEDANVHNRNYLNNILVEMRIIDAILPDKHKKIFGTEFDSPIMMPAFSHLNKVGKDGKKPMLEYAKAAKALNILNWVGMEPDDEFKEIADIGAKTVRIIKPFADHDIIRICKICKNTFCSKRSFIASRCRKGKAGRLQCYSGISPPRSYSFRYTANYDTSRYKNGGKRYGDICRLFNGYRI